MSANVGTVRATMVLDDSQFKVAIREAKRSVKELTENMKSMVSAQKNANSSMASWANAIKHARKEQSELSNATRNAATSIGTSAVSLAKNTYHITKVGAAYSDASKKVTDAVNHMATGGFDSISAKTKTLTADIKGLSSATQGYSRALGKLGSTGAALGALDGSQIKGFDALAGSMKRADGSAVGLIGQMKNLASRLGIVMTAAYAVRGALRMVGNAIKDTVMDAVDFDKQAQATKTVLGGFGADIDKVSAQARKLSTQYNMSATEISKAQEDLAKSGFKANEVLALTPAILDGAVSSGEDVAKVSKSVTDAMFAVGVGAAGASAFVDKLTTAANLTKADMTDFGIALKYVGAQGRQMGVPLDQMISSMMVLRQAGFSATQMGTKLRNVMANIVSPTKKGAGALKELGITSDIFLKKGLVGVVEQLEKARGKFTDARISAELFTAFGKETGPALAQLMMEGVGVLQQYDQALDQLGTAAAKAEDKADNLKDVFGIMGKTIKSLIVDSDIFKFMLEGIKNIAIEVTKALIAMKNLATTGSFSGLNDSGTAEGVSKQINTLKQERALLDQEMYDLVNSPYQSNKMEGFKFDNRQKRDKLTLQISGLENLRKQLEAYEKLEAPKPKNSPDSGEGIEDRTTQEETLTKFYSKWIKAIQDAEQDRFEKQLKDLSFTALPLPDAAPMISSLGEGFKKINSEHTAVMLEAEKNIQSSMMDTFRAGTQIFTDGGKSMFLLAGEKFGQFVQNSLLSDKSVMAGVFGAGTAGAGMMVGLPPEMGAAAGGAIAELLAETKTMSAVFSMMATGLQNLIGPLAEITMLFGLINAPILGLAMPLYLLGSVVSGLFGPFMGVIGMFWELVMVLGEFISVSLELWMWGSIMGPLFKAMAEGMRTWIDLLGVSVEHQKTKLPQNSHKFKDMWDKLAQNLENGFPSLTTETERAAKGLSQLNEELKGLNTSFRLRRRIAEVSAAAGGSLSYANRQLRGPSDIRNAGRSSLG